MLANAPCLVVACLLATAAVLPGCLKRQDDAQAQEAEKRFIVGRWAFRRLEAAEEAFGKGDYAKARVKLAEMHTSEELNAHERALMWQLEGNMHAEQQQYDQAVDALSKCLQVDALPEAARRTVEYNLGQLHAITGDYANAVVRLEAWLEREEKDPPREIQQILANAHVQLRRFDRALVYADALAKATPTADENLLRLQLAIHFQLDHPERMVELLTELIERFPKKTYWLQLSAAHSQLGDDRRALAVLELAHRQGLLTQGDELVRLARHYLHMNLPDKAAELLERELASDRVPGSAKHLELLANSWMAAREPDKATGALAKAAQVAQDGEPFLRLGQLQMQREHWGPAQQSLQRALKKGGLRDTGTAYLLLGNSQYELGQRAAAQQSFHRAQQHDSTKASAKRWMAVMKGEDDSCPTGNEAACKLIPGRR